jgi:hypothetical protein
MPAVITRACPLACLASVLSRVTYEALVAGIDAAPATVGDVVALCEQGKLTELPEIGSGRRGEIRRCLVALELVEPEGGEAIWLIRRELYVVEHGVGCGHGAVAIPLDNGARIGQYVNVEYNSPSEAAE